MGRPPALDDRRGDPVGGGPKKRLRALGRYLGGVGSLPDLWLVSVVAETFKLSPSAALAEIEHGPAGLVEQVLEARTFAQRWREADKPLDERELYLDDLAELVDEIKAEVAEEEAELMVAELESWKR